MLIFGSWQIAKYIIIPLKYQTRINQLLLIAFVSLGFGAIYDSLRTFSFMFFGGVWADLDRVGYFLKIFLLFMGVSAALRIILVLNEQSGHKIGKKENFIRYFYIILTLVISIVNYYTYETTAEVPFFRDSKFYAYQLDPYLYLFTVVFYIPFFFYLLYKIRPVLKVVKNKQIATQIIVLGILMAVLFNERNINIVGYYFFKDHIVLTIVEFSLIAAIALVGFVLTIKYPRLLEEISVHFSVNSIYLLRKEGGQVLYGNIIRKTDSPDSLTPDRLFLGGFINAMSSGLEETLQISGEIKTIKVADVILLFHYSEYLIGILFVAEHTPLAHERLRQFVKKFATHFESDLEQWTGTLTEFDAELLQDWIDEIFHLHIENKKHDSVKSKRD